MPYEEFVLLWGRRRIRSVYQARRINADERAVIHSARRPFHALNVQGHLSRACRRSRFGICEIVLRYRIGESDIETVSDVCPQHERSRPLSGLELKPAINHRRVCLECENQTVGNGRAQTIQHDWLWQRHYIGIYCSLARSNRRRRGGIRLRRLALAAWRLFFTRSRIQSSARALTPRIGRRRLIDRRACWLFPGGRGVGCDR